MPEPTRSRARRALLGTALAGAGVVLGWRQARGLLPNGLLPGALVPWARPEDPAGPGPRLPERDRAQWTAFRDRFVAADGRVVDTGNAGLSHSEGQGYGLLFAEWAGDRSAFERILDWTRRTLARRDDRLFAWRPRNGAGQPDNSTDGDLTIAWALLRASRRWPVPPWRDEATAIASDIAALCTREVAGRTVLLPGASGFVLPHAVVLNPSYVNLAAISALAGLVPGPELRRLHADGPGLLDAARFGRWGLPADWVEMDLASGALRPAAGWPQRFSWDAVRVPLLLAWAGRHGDPALAAAARFWQRARPERLPAWAELGSGAVSPYEGHAGVRAVALLAAATQSQGGSSDALPGQDAMPDYYAAALGLLARIAWREGGVPA